MQRALQRALHRSLYRRRRSRTSKIPAVAPARLVFLPLLPLLASCIGSANSAGAEVGISGGVHDFAGRAPNEIGALDPIGARSDSCHFCHLPRERVRADYGGTGILWNQQASTGSSWRLYGSDPTMLNWIDGALEPAPTGSSKICLSCHDGVAAPNQSDGRTPGSNALSAAAAPSFRSSVTVGATSAGLTNNHPISISYAWTRDSQLHDPVSAVMGDGRSVAALLENGRVECVTCHDVHSSDPGANGAMLRTSNRGEDISGRGASGLCLVCHDK